MKFTFCWSSKTSNWIICKGIYDHISNLLEIFMLCDKIFQHNPTLIILHTLLLFVHLSFLTECEFSVSPLTRTTIVVRNAGCARSRYTLKFFSMNESINEQSISRTAHPPLKMEILKNPYHNFLS